MQTSPYFYVFFFFFGYSGSLLVLIFSTMDLSLSAIFYNTFRSLQQLTSGSRRLPNPAGLTSQSLLLSQVALRRPWSFQYLFRALYRNESNTPSKGVLFLAPTERRRATGSMTTLPCGFRLYPSRTRHQTSDCEFIAQISFVHPSIHPST